MKTITNERITIQMSVETKKLLERALVLSGHSSLSSFITDAAVSTAQNLIKQETSLELCQKEAVSFLNALDKQRQVNPHFQSAAYQYKEKISRYKPD